MTWTDDHQPLPASGWYADPGGSGGLRYWDGSTWTGHVTPPAPSPAPGAPAPPRVEAPPPVARRKTSPWIWVAIGAVVVVVLGGAVAAVAVPVFHAARDVVWDEEAKDNLRDGHAAAVTVRSSAGTFTPATPEQLQALAPGLRFTAGASTHHREISVGGAERRVTVAVRSRSGTCWVIDDDDGRPGSEGYRTGRLPGDAGPCLATAGAAAMEPEDF